VLFLDSADPDQCERWVAGGVAQGVTTNATILARSDEPSVTLAVKRILAHDPAEVHAQVLPEGDDEAFEHAVALAEVDRRVRVKIPFVTSEGRHRAALIRRACAAGIPVNVTACTSLAQLHAALSLGPAYVSVLWCRTRDAGFDPARTVEAVAGRRDRLGAGTRIVIGSIRAGEDVTDALAQATDIVTVPPPILRDWLDSPSSVEMARQFARDAAGLTA
jgi:transaldolase